MILREVFNSFERILSWRNTSSMSPERQKKLLDTEDYHANSAKAQGSSFRKSNASWLWSSYLPSVSHGPVRKQLPAAVEVAWI
jgi:hypothetical protein